MRLLFVHDHPFYEENSIYYSGGGLPADIWNNYLINFEAVKVVGRATDNLASKKVISSHDHVSFHLIREFTSEISLLKNSKIIKQQFKQLIENVEVVLIRLPSVLGYIAGKEALKQNKKIWVEQVGHAKDALKAHGSWKGKLVANFFHKRNLYYTARADFVSYVTETQLQKIYPHSKSAISVSLSNVDITEVLEENQISKERFFSSELDIGLIGGFNVAYKGQKELLLAMSQLPLELKNNINLHFVGLGDYQWLLNHAESLKLLDNIKFIGALEKGNPINQKLKSLSLYIQPSLTEGMPRATIEAMAMGCPVISSTVGGLPDIVNSRWLHQPSDITTLSKHIQELYLNRSILFEEATRSLKVAQRYHRDILKDRRQSFYKKMNKLLNEN